MALVAFLRGVNVGGHRRFRPSELTKELQRYDVVNIGAAGTFVVRKPGERRKFYEALRAGLPFDAEMVVCEGRDLLRLETLHPFGEEESGPDIVRFVSFLGKAGKTTKPLPAAFPSEREWLVRVIEKRGQFVFGMYRRHMKTIRYLGEVDKLFDGPVTTRNWNTIAAIIRVLRNELTIR